MVGAAQSCVAAQGMTCVAAEAAKPPRRGRLAAGSGLWRHGFLQKAEVQLLSPGEVGTPTLGCTGGGLSAWTLEGTWSL